MVSWTTSIVSSALAVAGGRALSVTVTVKLASPSAVGVPEMTPVELRASPAGSAPLVTFHVSAPAPPLPDSGNGG